MRLPYIPSLRRFAYFLMFSVMGFWACHLGETNIVEETVTFPSLYDSLKGYDSAVIVFTTENGTLIDTVFKGKLTSPTQLENLKVEKWDGGKVHIVITGFKNGVAVYGIQKKFNGKTDVSEGTFVILDPGTSLTYPMRELQLLEGDSLPFPDITIKPANLSDKSLIWTSSNPEVLLVGDSFLKAIKPGTADVIITLQSNAAKTLMLRFTIEIDGKIPQGLSFSVDTLYLATKGAPGSLQVSVQPNTASKTVTWRVDDSTIASVGEDGLVRGLKKGNTRLWAISKAKPSLYDSAVVDVSDPVAVASVRFLKESTDIFIRGAAESLGVEVLPPKANPAVEFSVSDQAKLSIVNGRLSGLVEGNAFVYVVSMENPGLKDTLVVHILPSQIVDSVRLSSRSLKLFTGGESQTLTAKVMPVNASPKIQWSSSQSGIAYVDATGKVSPVAPGSARIYAISLADSLKQDSADVNVKVDAPKLTAGQDTVISLGQTISFLPSVAQQEYGLIVKYKWDLDGNGEWDDSSDAVKAVSYKFDQEKEYAVRFYVRDTEGNPAIAVKSVRAVKGPVINIVSPANNSYSRTAEIAVKWTVNEVEQDSLKTALLINGANTIRRTVRDAAGTPFSTSITVTLDSLAPNKPPVHGPLLIANTQPTWTWATGGSGGNGSFRAVLDLETFDAAVESKDTVFTPTAPLTEGPHTLYVQERDIAGNWSVSGTLVIRIDITAPGVPDVKVNPAGSANSPKPAWTWTSTGGGNGAFQYKLDSFDFSTGATTTGVLTYVPVDNLLAGPHTLYVRERDSTGNWSLPGNAAVTLDFIAPTAPKMTGSSPTSLNPKWTWSTGGNGGAGDYRSHLGADPTAADAISKALEFSFTTPVSGTTYTLYVQERDAAGNWSESAILPIKYDLTKPTVNISLPQASGTYITNVDGATALVISGVATANAPNTITKVSYSLDDGAQVAATLGTNGVWSASVAFPLEKTYTVKVTATDNLNNTGEAALSILRDRTAPPAPKIETSPSTPRNSTTGTWTWSQVPELVPGSGVNGRFRYSLNGGTSWIETSGFTASITTLKEGVQIFSLQQQDNANNWSFSATNSVTLDQTPPDPVTFSGTDGSYTDTQKPTWTWTPSTSNGGIASYVLMLDAGAEFDHSGTSYTPSISLSDNLTHSLLVRQKDQVPGVHGLAKSFSYKIKVNAAAAPIVSSAGGGSSGGPTNNLKFSWNSSGGGNGTYRVRINNDGAYQSHPQPGESQTTWSLAGNSADGAYTIRVSEQDVMGRWGAEGTFTIQLDRTGPSITNLEVKWSLGNYSLREGLITNRNSITISYKQDLVDKETDCLLGIDNGTNLCFVEGSDALGNKTTVTRNIWKRSKVVFVKKGGIGDGSSWEEATGNLSGVLGNLENNSKEIWVSSGSYSGSITMTASVMLLGGFNSDDFPVTANSRNKSATTLPPIIIASTLAATIDGFVFAGQLYIAQATVSVLDCKFTPDNGGTGGIAAYSDSKVSVTNIAITNEKFNGPILKVIYGELTLMDGAIVGNELADYSAISLFGDLYLKGNFKLYNNSVLNPEVSHAQLLMNDGTLDVGVNVDLSRGDIEFNGGSGTFKGQPL